MVIISPHGFSISPNNGRLLVIGYRNPWVEACILEEGANEIVSLEYGAIYSKHLQLKTMVTLL
jgi:hypothetical protein